MASKCVGLVMILLASLAPACGGAPDKAYIPADSPLTPFTPPEEGAVAGDDGFGFTLDEEALEAEPADEETAPVEDTAAKEGAASAEQAEKPEASTAGAQ